ncbi:MAG: aminotransferase class V-fold PLP-dependent enzyme [Ruminococcaceae bacterium]|nr:aminotransferase class V-fold PLP-dependent enzyme [Oscillospiraceae bacterium]
MIYLDHGATSFPKPAPVRRAMLEALDHCANPGRGGHPAAMVAARTVYGCRREASEFFDCRPEQVIFTANCTQGLNVALRSMVRPGSRVVISGFEHNAVTRTLHLLGAKILVAGRRLFDPADTLEEFRKVLASGVDAAVFTHVSNVFGYILPLGELAALCRSYGVPFAVDAAQSAGCLELSLRSLGADYIAMPGHKGLLGPQGTGILLCGAEPQPLMAGGTGSDSALQTMPDFLPDRLEPGTVNVPGIAGLAAGIRMVRRLGTDAILRRERAAVRQCAALLRRRGFRVFDGIPQTGTVSFLPGEDCEAFAEKMARRGIALRAGLHCAPLAHESAGTLDTGTIRISFGHDADPAQVAAFARALDQ